MMTNTGDVSEHAVVDDVVQKLSEDVAKELDQIALETLEASGEFTPEQRLAIAHAIQATMSSFIPSMASAIGEAFKYFAEILAGQRELPPPRK